MIPSDYSSQYREDCFPTFVHFDLSEKDAASTMSSSDSGASTYKENQDLKRELHVLNESFCALKKQLEEQGRGKKQKGNKFSKYDMVSSTTETNIREYVSSTLFRAVKYYETPSLRREALDVVCKFVNINPASEVERVKQHVEDLIADAVNKSRDNKIKVLKRAVWRMQDGVGK